MGNFIDLFRLQVPDVERNYDGSPTDLHKEKVKLGKVPDEKYKVQGDSQFDNWMEDMEDGGVTPTPTPGGVTPLYPNRIKAYVYWQCPDKPIIIDGEMVCQDGLERTPNGFIELPNLASYYQFLGTAKGIFDFENASSEGGFIGGGKEEDPTYPGLIDEPGTPVVVGPGRNADSDGGSGTKGITSSNTKGKDDVLIGGPDDGHPFPFNPTYYQNLFYDKMDESPDPLNALKTIDFKSDTKLSNDNEWFGMTRNESMPIQDMQNTLWNNYMYFDTNENGATFDGGYGLDTIIYPVNMEDTIKELIFSDYDTLYERSSSAHAKMSAYCEAHGVTYDWDSYEEVMVLLDTEVRAAGYDDFNVSILDFTGKSCLLGVSTLVGLTKAETIQWLAEWWGDNSLYYFLKNYLYYPMFVSDRWVNPFYTQDESTIMYTFYPEFNTALPRGTKPSDVRVMLVCSPNEVYIESPDELPKYELPRIAYCEVLWDDRDEESTSEGTKYTVPIKFYDNDNNEITPKVGDAFPGSSQIWVHGEDAPSRYLYADFVVGWNDDDEEYTNTPNIGEWDNIEFRTQYDSKSPFGGKPMINYWYTFRYRFSEDAKHVVAYDSDGGGGMLEPVMP